MRSPALISLAATITLAACGPRYEVVEPTDQCTPCDVKEALAANEISGAVDCTPKSGKAADLIACAQDARKKGQASHASLKLNLTDLSGGTELFEAKDGKVTAILWRGASSWPGACSASVALLQCDRIPSDPLAPFGAPEGCGHRKTICQSKPVKRVLRSGRVASLWCVPQRGGPLLCGPTHEAVEASEPKTHAAHPDKPLQCTESPDKLLTCSEV